MPVRFRNVPGLHVVHGPARITVHDTTLEADRSTIALGRGAAPIFRALAFPRLAARFAGMPDATGTAAPDFGRHAGADAVRRSPNRFDAAPRVGGADALPPDRAIGLLRLEVPPPSSDASLDAFVSDQRGIQSGTPEDLRGRLPRLVLAYAVAFEFLGVVDTVLRDPLDGGQRLQISDLTGAECCCIRVTCHNYSHFPRLRP
ncbi:hypothetical protein [Bifidobacterium phasiani]|uniref:hypothetical protein n=1 Tax=Bifidobacterium phasiani TaxID=2834431 RepID=UPI001C59672E